MAVSLPSDPVIGATYTSGSSTWRWNGSAWQRLTTGVVSLPTGAITLDDTGWSNLSGTNPQAALNSVDAALNAAKTALEGAKETASLSDPAPKLFVETVASDITINNSFFTSRGLSPVPTTHILSLRLINSAAAALSITWDSNIKDVGQVPLPSLLQENVVEDVVLWTYDGGTNWDAAYTADSSAGVGLEITQPVGAAAPAAELTPSPPTVVYSEGFVNTIFGDANNALTVDFTNIPYREGDLLLVVMQANASRMNPIVGNNGYFPADVSTDSDGDGVVSNFSSDWKTFINTTSTKSADVGMFVFYLTAEATHLNGGSAALGAQTWATLNPAGSRCYGVVVVRGHDAGFSPATAPYSLNHQNFSSNYQQYVTRTMVGKSVAHAENSLLLCVTGFFARGDLNTTPTYDPNVDYPTPRLDATTSDGSDQLTTPSGMTKAYMTGVIGNSGNKLRNVQKLAWQQYTTAGNSGDKTSTNLTATNSFNDAVTVMISIPS
ncbi:MAG: hypothetical protein VW907_00605 [Opitutae bacterium]